MRYETVADIMQKKVLTVEEDWTLEQLAAFLIDHRISGAPVIDTGGKLTGVVSLTDVVRYSTKQPEPGRDASTHEYFLKSMEEKLSAEEIPAFHLDNETQTRVRDIMTDMIFAITDDASIKEAAKAMIEKHIHRLLVLRKERVIGIVTALDLMRVLSDL